MSNFIELDGTSIITVIGRSSCDSCQLLKDTLKKMDFPFIYQNMEDLDQTVKMDIVNSRKRSGVKNVGLPVWIYKGKLYSGVPNKDILLNIVNN